MAPACAGHVRPPLQVVVERYGMVRRARTRPSRQPGFRRRAGKSSARGVRSATVTAAGGVHESREFHVGDDRRLSRTRRHGHGGSARVTRCEHSDLSVGYILSAHPELAAGNPCHSTGAFALTELELTPTARTVRRLRPQRRNRFPHGPASLTSSARVHDRPGTVLIVTGTRCMVLITSKPLRRTWRTPASRYVVIGVKDTSRQRMNSP
jgi:hypothetical protein